MIDPVTYGIVGLVLIAIGAICTRKRREDKFWVEAGIRNAKGEYPYLISKDATELKTTYIIEIPAGVDGKKLLDGGKYNHMLRQHFTGMKTADISLLDGHRLAIVTYHKDLPDSVPFKYAPGKPLEVPIGVGLRGQVVLALGDANPHVLVAGVTGGGKSTLLRLVITWLVINNVETHLTDLKGGLEQHLFTACSSVASCDRTVEEGLATLRALVQEMNRRIDLLYEAGKQHYTELGLPPAVLVIDELADYEDESEAMDLLTELGRKSRATGIYSCVATQRPESKVMAGSYKVNVPTRICFRMPDEINSRIVLGHGGAELLKDAGRCIYKNSKGKIEMQAAYLSAAEAERLIEPVKVQKRANSMSTTGVL